MITALLTAAFEAALVAFAPAASAALGVYAPLIAVNCLALGVASRGSSESPGKALLEGLARGAQFAVVLVLIALIREVLGSGTITLFRVGGFAGTVVITGIIDQPARALGAAGGGLLCLGYLAGVFREVTRRVGAKSPATGGV